MILRSISWDEATFKVGESYYVRCNKQGLVFLVSGEQVIRFSVTMLADMRVRFANHVQRLGDMPILMDHIIQNDICRGTRSVNFVVVEASPQVVFAVKLMPLYPHAP